jgi:hypothetical protein
MTAMGEKIKADKLKTEKIKSGPMRNGNEMDGVRIDGVTIDGIALDVHSDSAAVRPMRDCSADRYRFTMTELAALRQDLLQGGMVDSYDAAQLLQIFLIGRGYGVSPQDALDAAGRVEMAGCALPVLQHELENLALVM